MLIQLNPRSREAIYLQIVSQLKQLVAHGALLPGAQLPTVRQLARELQLNPNTVARAYTQLIQEGVIAAQQGRGTYVYQKPLPELRRVRRERLSAEIDSFLRDAQRFGYAPDEIDKIWRERFAAWRKARASK